MEKKSDWIIDGGCLHDMIGDMNKFVKFKNHDGWIVRVGNNATCHITGIGSITLDGKTNIDDVCFVGVLKHNLLSVEPDQSPSGRLLICGDWLGKYCTCFINSLEKIIWALFDQDFGPKYNY